MGLSAEANPLNKINGVVSVTSCKRVKWLPLFRESLPGNGQVLDPAKEPYAPVVYAQTEFLKKPV